MIKEIKIFLFASSSWDKMTHLAKKEKHANKKKSTRNDGAELSSYFLSLSLSPLVQNKIPTTAYEA